MDGWCSGVEGGILCKVMVENDSVKMWENLYEQLVNREE